MRTQETQGPMSKKPDLLDLRADRVEDSTLRDNFQAIEEFINDQNILAGQWRYFEVEFDGSEHKTKFRHHLKFIPTDIIITSLEGHQSLEWQYKSFDRDYVLLHVHGPCRIKGFLGRYQDNKVSALSKEPMDYMVMTPSFSGWWHLPLNMATHIQPGTVSINTRYEKQSGFIKHSGFIKGSA